MKWYSHSLSNRMGIEYEYQYEKMQAEVSLPLI